MTRVVRSGLWLGMLIAIVAVLAYLRDPPWIGSITSGLRPWSHDRAGTAFRWTNGHAAFYVPSDAASMTLPVRPGLPRPNGRTVAVAISIDGRWLVTRTLGEAERWVQMSVPIADRTTRRHRRVEVRVDAVIAQRNLGVQLGEVTLHRLGVGR